MSDTSKTCPPCRYPFSTPLDCTDNPVAVGALTVAEWFGVVGEADDCAQDLLATVIRAAFSGAGVKEHLVLFARLKAFAAGCAGLQCWTGASTDLDYWYECGRVHAGHYHGAR